MCLLLSVTGQVFTQCRSLYLECTVHTHVHLVRKCTNHYFYIIVGLNELERAALNCRLTQMSAQFSIFQLLVLLYCLQLYVWYSPISLLGTQSGLMWAKVGFSVLFLSAGHCLEKKNKWKHHLTKVQGKCHELFTCMQAKPAQIS